MEEKKRIMRTKSILMDDTDEKNPAKKGHQSGKMSRISKKCMFLTLNWLKTKDGIKLFLKII